MLILRFETELGHGVYSHLGVPHDFMNEVRHPGPRRDQGLAGWWATNTIEERAQYLYGFDSVKQARSWFYDKEVLQTMQDWGCILKVLYVPEEDIEVGYAQTVFLPGSSKLLETFAPTDLHSRAFPRVIKGLKTKANEYEATL